MAPWMCIRTRHRLSAALHPASQVEVIVSELRRRKVATWGRKDQLASREPAPHAPCRRASRTIKRSSCVVCMVCAAELCAACRGLPPACPPWRGFQVTVGNRAFSPPFCLHPGLYGALKAEGRALSKEESAIADAELGLDDIGTVGLGSSSDSDWEGGSEADAAAVAAGELASSKMLAENPLLALQSSLAGRFLTELNQERLISNFSSLQLYFLWGATAPNGIKLSTTCLARTAKGVWLFECGEDAQRHLSQ